MAQTEAQRRWYAANRERVLARQAEYRAANPDKIKEKNQRWYQENREGILAQQKQWKRANPGKVAAQAARRYAKNPEAARAAGRARYHRASERRREYMARYREEHREYFKVKAALRRKQLGEGDLTLEQWQEILEFFDHCCAYCQVRDAKLQIEHMTPLSRGGQHTASNVVPSCQPCNQRKFTKTLDEFLDTL